MNRTRFVLLAATLSVAATAFAQQPAATNPQQARPPAPRLPHGNEMGFFRPQADPALTRIVPAAPASQAEPASTLRLERNPDGTPAELASQGNVEMARSSTAELERRLEKEEDQMDRAESEHAVGKAQLNQYAPPGSPGFDPRK